MTRWGNQGCCEIRADCSQGSQLWGSWLCSLYSCLHSNSHNQTFLQRRGVLRRGGQSDSKSGRTFVYICLAAANLVSILCMPYVPMSTTRCGPKTKKLREWFRVPDSLHCLGSFLHISVLTTALPRLPFQNCFLPQPAALFPTLTQTQNRCWTRPPWLPSLPKWPSLSVTCTRLCSLAIRMPKRPWALGFGPTTLRTPASSMPRYLSCFFGPLS